MKYVTSPFLAAAITLALLSRAQALPPDETSPDRFSRIRMDGAPVSRDYRLPLSLLTPYVEPGALLTKEGLVMRYRDGFLSARWEVIPMLEVEDGILTISVGTTLYEDVAIPLSERETSGPRQPAPRDPEDFLAALLQFGGYVHDDERPGGDVYVRQGRAASGMEPRFFPYTGMADWPQGWTPAELAKLPSRCGLSINETGVAWTQPFGVQAIRWEEVDQLRTPDDDRQTLSLELFDLANGSSLYLSYPGELYLSYPDLCELSRSLRGKFCNAESSDDTGRFREPPKPAFYASHTTCPEYVAPSTILPTGEEQALPFPTQGPDLWPNEIREAGLYLVPSGVWEAKNFTVARIPFDAINQLYGEMDGSIEVFPSAVFISPTLLRDGGAYRQLRRDIVSAVGLIGDGQAANFVRSEESTTPTHVEPHYYKLAPELGWKGLPLEILGPDPWPNGLYLLPEGLVSVSDSWIGLSAWSDVNSLTVVDDEEEGGSIFASTHGEALTATSFPPTRFEEPPCLAVNAAQARAAIERYVTLDSKGVPHPRPVAKMPTERTRLEWRGEPGED